MATNEMLVGAFRALNDDASDLPTERHVQETLYGMVVNLRPQSEVEQLQAIAGVCLRRLRNLQDQS